MRFEILFGGRGGQGIVFAGLLLARAAALYEGLHAVHSQLYGPEARGGASRSDVVISDRPILYPRVRRADALALLSQEAYEKYVRVAKEGSLVLVDASLVDASAVQLNIEGLRIRAEDLSSLSLEAAGTRSAVNVAAVGYLATATGVVKLSSLEKTLKELLAHRPSSIDRNIRALRAGAELAEKSEDPR